MADNVYFIKKVKSGGNPPLFTKQTTKITLQTLLFTKNQSTQVSSKKIISQSQIRIRYVLTHCFINRNKLTFIGKTGEVDILFEWNNCYDIKTKYKALKRAVNKKSDNIKFI